MLQQKRNIFSSVAKGRKIKGKYIETEEQVLTELSLPDCLCKILIGCCNQPDRQKIDAYK